MLDVRVVANYFGKPPRIFQLWLDSCGANATVKWLFYTDIDMTAWCVPANMEVHKVDFDWMKRKLQTPFPYEIHYAKPWDFCAFKAVIGIAFAEELAGADFWGWSDVDVIFGDLTPVLDLAERGYDKVMPNGHFSIIRNSTKLNDFIFNHPRTKIAITSDESGNSQSSCFDERHFRFTVLHDYGAKQASEVVPYIHIYPRWGHFKFHVSYAAGELLGLPKDVSRPFVFTWRDGHLTGHFAMPDRTVKTLDLAYVHFFKRNIRDFTGGLKCDGTTYLIVPTGIVRCDKLTKQGGGVNYWQIIWLNRPRIHWKYIWDRLSWKVFKRKFARIAAKFRKSPSAAQDDGCVYHAGC